MAAHQAPPSLGFSRQERWSGLPFPSPMHESEKWKWSRSVVSDSSRPHGLQPTRLLRPWDFPSKSTGVWCHCLLWQQMLGGKFSRHRSTKKWPGWPWFQQWHHLKTLVGCLFLKLHILGIWCINSGLSFGLPMSATRALEPPRLMALLY